MLGVGVRLLTARCWDRMLLFTAYFTVADVWFAGRESRAWGRTYQGFGPFVRYLSDARRAISADRDDHRPTPLPPPLAHLGVVFGLALLYPCSGGLVLRGASLCCIHPPALCWRTASWDARSTLFPLSGPGSVIAPLTSPRWPHVRLVNLCAALFFTCGTLVDVRAGTEAGTPQHGGAETRTQTE